MKIATARDFQEDSDALLDGKEPVFIEHNGTTAGVYIPMDSDEMPRTLRMELVKHLARKNREALEARGLTEEEVIAEFEASRKARR